MKRLQTDFVCSSSSFLSGFGSVVNIRGELYEYNTSDNPDEIAIASDWLMVGQDIRHALKKAETELPAATRK